MTSKTETLEREKRWTLPAGIAAVMAVAIYFVGQFVGRSGVGSPDGTAEFLSALSGNHSTALLGGVLQGLGLALLAIPLVFLYLAALARSDRMRRGFILVAVVGPVFFGLGSIASTVTLLDASDEWRGDDTPAVVKCFHEDASDNGSSDGGALTDDQKDDCRNDAADDLRDDQSLVGLALGLSLSGAIGFLVALMYTSLNAMRVGLLSRFWGSLGMAVGVLLILPGLQFLVLAFFVYLGLLFAGWLPGGRPRAWQLGEALPWPMPGQAAPDDDVIEGTADEIEDDGEAGAGEAAPGELESGDEPQGERRKRKKRNG